MTHSHVHPIEVGGEIAGLAVRQRRGFAFYASLPGFRVLEARSFRRRREVEQAARALGASASGLKALLLAAVSLTALSLASPQAQAGAIDPATAARIEALEASLRQQQAQIELQQSQIRDLKTGTSSQVAEVRRSQAEQPTLTFKNGRPTLATADGQFSLALRSTVQADWANYLQHDGGDYATSPRRGSFGDAAEGSRARDFGSGSNFRRAQIGFQGKLFGDFDYSAIYEFGGSSVEEQGRISQAWIGYSGLKPVQFRIGALAPPAGLDDAFSSRDSLFLERAAPAELARATVGGDGRSAVGVQGSGDVWFASGYLTGSSVTTATVADEQTAVVGRVAYVPYKDADITVHVGLNGSFLFSPPQADPSTVYTKARTTIRLRDRPELRVDGTRLIDTGNINAEDLVVGGAELGATWKSLFVSGEYFLYHVDRSNLGSATLDDPEFSGFYGQAAYALTGEKRTWDPATGGFSGLKPTNPLNLDGSGFGALEVAGRFSHTNLNHNAGSPGEANPTGAVRGGIQDIWTLGLNWYPNSNVRFLLDYQWTAVDRLSDGSTDFPTRGLQIGQNFQAVSLRSQFAF